MKRWRTVGLIGTPTADGRVIVGRVTLRGEQVPLGRVPDGDRYGHVGAVYDHLAEVRIEDEKIQARLRWRDRHATPAFDHVKTEFADETLMVLRDPRLIGLCVGGPSAWADLR